MDEPDPPRGTPRWRRLIEALAVALDVVGVVLFVAGPMFSGPFPGLGGKSAPPSDKPAR